MEDDPSGAHTDRPRSNSVARTAFEDARRAGLVRRHLLKLHHLGIPPRRQAVDAARALAPAEKPIHEPEAEHPGRRARAADTVRTVDAAQAPHQPEAVEPPAAEPRRALHSVGPATAPDPGEPVDVFDQPGTPHPPRLVPPPGRCADAEPPSTSDAA